MNKFTAILLLFVTINLPLCGQKIVPSPEDLYSDALEFIASGDYADALLLLMNLNDRGYNSANINYKIGECYLNIQGQKTRAIPFLKQAVQHISDSFTGETLSEQFAPPKALFFLGIAYRLNYDFENALVYFNNYRQYFLERDRENVRMAEYHIERCNYARELMAAPARFTTDTLDEKINTFTSNFNPLVTADEKLIYYMNELKFYDAIMRSVRMESDWTEPENLTPQIKSDGDHYLTGLSSDGTMLFLTYYDPYRSGEIFVAEFKEGTWSEMIKLNDEINTLFNETHASLSPDNDVLYFTSDRKGGYGGLDIYRTTKGVNGDWGSPVNLGPLINTPYNEETPFVSSDGRKLFFSSQGHYNMGGYDVFYASRDEEGNWLPPVNIGYPLNSTDDDLFFLPIDSGNIAYQARFNQTAPQKDIVRYSISEFGKPKRFIINGKIEVQAEPDYPSSDISVAFINTLDKDTVAVRPLNEDGTFRQKLAGGKYQVDFKNNQGTLLIKELSIPEYFPHDNLVMQEKLVVPSKMHFDTLYLKNIRFDFNRTGISDYYRIYLDELINVMNKFPEITLQINGYADAVGSESYNMELSLQRAVSLRATFTNRINSIERITTKAFGEQNPVAINHKADGEDSPEGRSYNRRAEVLLLNVPETLIIIKVNDIPETISWK